ncbi:hypothetical protein V1520DRAFT_351104 [Lipomyces starkeyi]|uniref:Uncharacterized protein n=1 Tax=Lipomyces starkeyi NRRL Y-11557 TaxID=675824 RepID=A0A1E3QCC4_LIPST|nr:hypothetical protein LIPSTDRAFT_69487 [Lipomyces starkeyi NRRL Y-11557]
MIVFNWHLILFFVGVAPLCFVYYVHPRSSFQHLKSSAAFVKRAYNTDSLLADAASAKYKVHIGHDARLSSCSYTLSPYIPSVLIPSRTSRQKRKVLYGSVYFVVVYGLLSIVLVWGAVVSYVNVDNSIPVDAVWSLSLGAIADCAIALVCLLLGIATVKSSFKEDDASCATVYFNSSEENWAESSEVALFNSSEKIEIAINCVEGLLVYVSLGIFIFGSPLLYTVDTSREKKRDRETAISLFLRGGAAGMSVGALGLYLTGLVMMIRMRRQICVSTVEVQLAPPINLECTEKADVFKFDVKKIVRKFADDLAKNLSQNWMASNGAYYYFIIAGEEGGLVYGRMSATKGLADP